MDFTNSKWIKTILVITILIVVNVIFQNSSFRIDLTKNNRYSLSRATEDILSEIEDPISVKVYLTKDLPSNVASISQEIKDLLIEYNTLSSNNLIYEFINPNESEEEEQKAQQAGIRPVLINVRNDDKVSQQRAYIGVVLSYDDKKEVIPFIQPSDPIEYLMTSAIKKLAVINKPTVALLQGHGEPTLQNIEQAFQKLSVSYNLKPVKLDVNTVWSSDIKTAILLDPTDTLDTISLSKIDEFVKNGGNLFVGLNRVDGDLQTAQGSVRYTGVADWLQGKGITVKPEFIIDAKCQNVTVQQRQGSFTINSQKPFPYIPTLSNFEDHPTTKGLTGANLLFASPLAVNVDSTIQSQVLIRSSAQSGSQPAPLYFQIDKQWTTNDFGSPEQPLAVALDGPIGGQINSKMIVVGDGDFPINSRGEGAQPRPQAEQNIQLLVNSIDWLTDDTGLIDLRSKSIQYNPIDPLEEGEASTMKYINFSLPLILILLIGVIRYQYKRVQKVKRMQMNYEEI